MVSASGSGGKDQLCILSPEFPGALGELIFETERASTRYLGDNGAAGFVPRGVSGKAISAKGYGRTTDLAVAA